MEIFYSSPYQKQPENLVILGDVRSHKKMKKGVYMVNNGKKFQNHGNHEFVFLSRIVTLLQRDHEESHINQDKL